MEPTFRRWRAADRAACLALFDANCPAYFAPNERADFVAFMDAGPATYEVAEIDGKVVAAFGLIDDGADTHLNWIMVAPWTQGAGLGSAIMQHVVASARARDVARIRIAASHKSAPFFARFGARAGKRTPGGWGPGMDRIDMVLEVGR